MSYRTPVTDTDLHAYVDAQLSPARHQEVEDYLCKHPEIAAELATYRQFNADLQRVYAPVLAEPLPVQLITQPSHNWLRVAAISAWLSIGGIIGWSLGTTTVVQTVNNSIEYNLVQPAAFAHAIYTAEVNHPVEVGADQQDHLVKWLSKRLHSELQTPDLTQYGYHLIGGRLLPSSDKMAAQFMYQRADGLRLTVYARRGAWENEETSFRVEQQGALVVFYWIDGPLGYALVGELNRDELFTISNAVYQQLR